MPYRVKPSRDGVLHQLDGVCAGRFSSRLGSLCFFGSAQRWVWCVGHYGKDYDQDAAWALWEASPWWRELHQQEEADYEAIGAI